jgi:hypothetical protein
VAVVATMLAVPILASGAVADSKQEGDSTLRQVQKGSSQRSITDGVVDTPYELALQEQRRLELEPNPPGLPPSKKNMKAVGRLKLTETDSVISDVTYHRGYAYLGEWIAACTEGEGGTNDSEVHVVDARNLKNPKKVATIPGNGNDWSGEGVHVIRHRGRDLLLLSSEPCDSNLDANVGGMTIVDVTNPRQPEKLVSNFGDWTAGGPDGDDCRDDVPVPCVTPHSVHSVMGWTDGNKAYAVQTDNEEFPDVDIFDITRPRKPVLIAETGLNDWVDPLLISDQVANGGNIFLHDFQVKQIDGEWRMMLSYWDVGWVLLDVEDPSNPTVVDDYDYPDPDPLTGFSPPEGNAHQSWWSKDNRFVVGTDEDFSPSRIDTMEITTGPNAGPYPAAAVGGGTGPDTLPDGKMNGPTVYGGYGCDASAPVPPRSDYDLELGSGEEAIIVLQRGPTQDPGAPEAACFPGEKAENGINAGWDAVLLVNRHTGSADTDEPFCGSGDFPAEPIVTACTTHDAFHRIFNTAPNHDLPVPPTGEPARGDEGEKVDVGASFDGWGYVQLFRGSNLNHVDQYAVRESLDPRYSSGFGDLSVHEVKTDPRGNYLGYISYYHAGARVVKFGPEGIREVGHFISGRGNNFWGTFPLPRAFGQKKTKGPIPVLMSDRDYGLYVLKYTGNQFTP